MKKEKTIEYGIAGGFLVGVLLLIAWAMVMVGVQ